MMDMSHGQWRRFGSKTLGTRNGRIGCDVAVGDKVYIHYIHCVQKKTPTYVFNYNSGVSWSIFILFVPVEREMNTLQFTYLQSDELRHPVHHKSLLHRVTSYVKYI